MGGVHHPPALGRVVLGGALLAGVIAASRLAVIPRSEIVVPQLTVQVQWPGASALLVEREITAPVERALHGVRGIRTVRSTSREAESVVEATLDPTADVAWIRLGVREQLEQLRTGFPDGASAPEVANDPLGADPPEPLALLTIHGPRTPRELARLLDHVVAPRLRAVPGVARVTVLGANSGGISVTVDPHRLRAHGLTLADVATQLASASLVRPLGLDRSDPTVRPVLMDERPRSMDALSRLPLVGAQGQLARLGTVAAIHEADEGGGRIHRVNGHPVIGLEVQGRPDADPRPIMTAIRRELAVIARDLPVGFRLTVERDGSAMLSRHVHDVTQRALAAALGVLVLVVMRWRATGIHWWVAGVIAGAIGATVLTLALWRHPVPIASLVLMVLASAPLAASAWRIRRRPAPSSARGRRRWTAWACGPLLLAGIALPVALLNGTTRALAGPPVLTVLCLALWLAAWTALGSGMGEVTRRGVPPRPCREFPLAGRLPGKTGRRTASRWGRRMPRVVRHPAWGAGLVALLTAVAFWFGVTPAAYRDTAGDGASASSLRVELRARRGTDPALIDRVLQPFERVALAHPGVAGTRASGAGAEARLTVEFAPSSLRTPVPRQLQDRFVARATQVGGMQLLVQGIGPAFQAGDGGSSQSAHRLQLAGYGWEALDSLALAVVARLQRTPRVRELGLSSHAWRDEPPGRELRVQPDRDVLRRLDLPVGDVAAVVAGAAGGPVARLVLPLDGDDQVVAVREANAPSRSRDALLASPLPSSRGQRIRLRDVAEFSERPVPAVITREAQQYVRFLHYEIRGTPRQAHRIQAGLRATVAPPPGFTITDRPTDRDPDADASLERPWRTAVLAVLFACLAAAFARNQIGAAMAVLLVMPATLAGALVGRALVGQAVTPESLAALVLASGVTAQLAVTDVEETLGPWWTLALTAASAGPFLLCAGPDTPGRLPAAMTLGGIGLGTVALALTRRVRRGFVPRPAVD